MRKVTFRKVMSMILAVALCMPLGLLSSLTQAVAANSGGGTENTANTPYTVFTMTPENDKKEGDPDYDPTFEGSYTVTNAYTDSNGVTQSINSSDQIVPALHSHIATKYQKAAESGQQVTSLRLFVAPSSMKISDWASGAEVSLDLRNFTTSLPGIENCDVEIASSYPAEHIKGSWSFENGDVPYQYPTPFKLIINQDSEFLKAKSLSVVNCEVEVVSETTGDTGLGETTSYLDATTPTTFNATNCTFTGSYVLSSGDATYTDCTFNTQSGEWAMPAVSSTLTQMTFDNCTFNNTSGSAKGFVNLYGAGTGTSTLNVNFDNCTFNSNSSNAINTPVTVADSGTYNVYFSGTTLSNVTAYSATECSYLFTNNANNSNLSVYIDSSTSSYYSNSTINDHSKSVGQATSSFETVYGEWTAYSATEDRRTVTKTCSICGYEESPTYETRSRDYSVTHSLTNLTATNVSATTAKYGTDYTLTLTPDQYYKLPYSVDVTIDGVAYTAQYNNVTGVVTIPGSDVTGVIEITATGEAQSYNVTTTITNAVSTGLPLATYNADYTATLYPNSGYALPDEIEVTIGGALLDKSNYTYDKTSGDLKILGSAITGEVVIKFDAVVSDTTSSKGITDGNGEATIKDPLDGKNKIVKVEIDGAPASNIPVEFDEQGNLKVTVPEADKNKTIKVTVSDADTRVGIENTPVTVVDNSASSKELGSGYTDGNGVFEILPTSGITDNTGQVTLRDPKDNSSKIVKVEIDGTVRPSIPVKFDESSNLTVTVPEADRNKRIKVTVADGTTNAGIKDVPVTVVDNSSTSKELGSGNTDEQGVFEILPTSGTTDKSGSVTLRDPSNNQNINVKVEIGGKVATNIPIEIDDQGKVSVKVPTADKDKEIKVTVTDQDKKGIKNKPVQITDTSGATVGSGTTNASGVYIKPAVQTDTSNTTITGVEGVVTVDGKVVKDGDKITLEADKPVKITWYPQRTASDNVRFLNIVDVSGTNYSAYDNIKKTNWKEDNILYNKKMKESGNKMITMDKVTSQMQTVNVVATTKNTIVLHWVETAPVYRMYNQITSEHLFSTSKSEYDNFVRLNELDKDWWIGEGIDWFSSIAEEDKVVYRLYNKYLGAMYRSSHYYTSDEAERANLIANWDWEDDGEFVQFKDAGRAPIYTGYSEDLGSAHHYTSNFTEWRGLDGGWDKEDTKNGLSVNGSSAKGFFNSWIGAK